MVRVSEELESRKGEPSEEKIAKDADNKAEGVTKEMCSGGDEEAIAKAARDKANAMTPQPGKTKSSSVITAFTQPMSPQKLAETLHSIAAKIEASKSPDPVRVAKDLQLALAALGFQSAVQLSK
jgi:ribosomal protein S8E